MSRNTDRRDRRRAERPRLEPLEGREVPATVGGLDPSFGAGGCVVQTGPELGTARAVAVDSHGRTVTAGQTPAGAGSDFAVLRFNPDGTPDPTFGTAGRQTIDFAGGFDVAFGVAIDPADDVVVVGSTAGGGESRFAVARLTSAGLLDPTFAGGGRAAFHVGTGADDAARAVAIDPDHGDILVVGSSDGTFAAARLSDSGAFYTPFGPGGAVAFPVPGTAYAVTVRFADVVIAGGDTATGKMAVIRTDANGTPDPRFGAGGVAEFGSGTADTALAVSADLSAHVVVAGVGTVAGKQLIEVVKLSDPGGTPDPAFGAGGVFAIDPGGLGSSRATGVAVRRDGRILVGGTTRTTNDRPPAGGAVVLRLTPDGVLDPEFNPAGPTPGVNRFTFPGVADPAVTGLAVTAEGRVVVAGTAATPPGVLVARLVGTVEEGRNLIVSGRTDPRYGVAAVFFPGADGQYRNVMGGGIPTPFAGLGVDLRAAVGDVDGDGWEDNVVATGPGIPTRFAVMSGRDRTQVLIPPTAPFAGSEDYSGGAFVAAADLDNDGRAEIVVSPDQGGGPRVTIFGVPAAGTVAVRANFLGIADAGFRGGARVAAGDVNGDGTADLVVAAGNLGGPRVAVFDGRTLFGTPTRLVADFFAFPGSDAVNLRNGAYVAAGDVDGDGKADLIFGGGPGGAPRVFALSGARVSAGDVAGAQANPVANFFVAGNTSDRGGVRVATTDADGDDQAEVAAGSGAGTLARVRVYLGKDFTTGGEPAAFTDLDPLAGAPLVDGVYVG